jgi:hypothetical protein
VRPASPKGERTVGPFHLVLLSFAALSLPANLLILAVVYAAATHQASHAQPAGIMAVSAAAVLFLLTGSMLWALRAGRAGLGAALAVVQLLPVLLFGGALVFASLR